MLGLKAKKPNGGSQYTSWFYALHAQQEVKDTLNFVISMLKNFNFDVYALLDPGGNLSSVIPFLANISNVCLEVLHEPFEVCTPVD